MSFEGSCHCGAIRFKVDAPAPSQAINLRCVPDIDLDSLALQKVDGAKA